MLAMLKNLESTIQAIITNAASSMATQLAGAIRQTLAAEIVRGPKAATAPSATTATTTAAATKRIGRHPGSKSKAKAAAASPAASNTAPAAAAPKRIGRPPGSKNKTAAPKAAPAASTPAAKGKRRSSKRRSITQAELDAILDVLKKKPGLTSVEIQKEAKLDAKQAARVLNKLRITKKVSLKGQRSKATYEAA